VGRVPILIGGAGTRTLRLLARFADACNVFEGEDLRRDLVVARWVGPRPRSCRGGSLVVTMDLREWIFGELDEIRHRVSDQVLALVPADRRLERPGGGNSIAYGLWHVATHADFALRGVLGGEETRVKGLGLGLPAGCGLAEAEHPAIATLDADVVTGYLGDVLDDVAAWLPDMDVAGLDRPADGGAALVAAGVAEDDFGWLYRMWDGKPMAYFLRWEVLDHFTNHVGEMVATRNRMGLSPF
jgi:hypothetical protein